MKILIIGSKGFIGSYAASFFSKLEGYEVFESDINFDYEKSNYFLIDATNSNFHNLMQSMKFDACINCSGAASVPNSITNPLQDFTLNTLNVFKILDAIRLWQPRCKFLNLSSAAVYGNPKVLPIAESAKCSPVSPYGIHKLQSEVICSEFTTYYGIATCSLRIFSAYGVGLKKQLLWDLYQKLKVSDDVELFGTGNETRDFIDVRDVARAIGFCLDQASFSGESINVACGNAVSIKELSEIYTSAFPAKRVIFNGLTKTGDPLYWQADVSLLKSFGFEPQITVQDGVKDYIKWVKNL